MIFAKPKNGFRWVETDHAKSQLKEIFSEHPTLAPQWQAIRELLSQTGHRDGHRLSDTGESNVFVFRARQANGQPDIQLIFTLLSDKLTVQTVRLRPIKA